MPSPPRIAALVAGLALAWGSPIMADVDAGAYLSARAALMSGDFTSAAPYLLSAISSDPDNPQILESAIMAQLGRGEFARAEPIALLLEETGTPSPRAAMVLIAADVRAGNWRGILDALDAGREVSPLADALARGWALAGAGDMQGALAAFDAMAETRGMRAFALQHKALALALAGDFEAAEAIYALPPGHGPIPTKSVIIAHAETLSQLGRGDDALALVEAALAQAGDPALVDLAARLGAEDSVPFTVVRDAAGGMAEAWFTIASALVDESSDLNVLIHARIAQAMNPGHVDALFLAAQILERMEQYTAAGAAYTAVPADHPLHRLAELGRADVMRRQGETGAAIEVLSALLRSEPDFGPAAQRLGDALRAADRGDEALVAYSHALELASPRDRGRWRLLFARAVTHFWLDDWDSAEVDFRAAIELEPDEPSLLNYYGYSLVDRGEKLDEALGLIERAVALDRDNGAYVDSLGWAYFRLGRFDDAVIELERAATLESADPVVNDHLGDAYWRVGRLREARFQWHRALSFNPEEEEAQAIRRKLESGLADAAQEDRVASGG